LIDNDLVMRSIIHRHYNLEYNFVPVILASSLCVGCDDIILEDVKEGDLLTDCGDLFVVFVFVSLSIAYHKFSIILNETLLEILSQYCSRRSQIVC
jgi:hypothetical protein